MENVLEYVPIETLATLLHVEAVEWDALGQQLVIQSLAGPEEDPKLLYLGLTPQAAQQLLVALSGKFEETNNGLRLTPLNDAPDNPS